MKIIPYNVIYSTSYKKQKDDFAPCNKSIMAKNFFQPIWNDF